jgi:hypothetical protein
MALIYQAAPGAHRYLRIGQPRTQAMATARGRDDNIPSVSEGATLEVFLYEYDSRSAREAGRAPVLTLERTWRMAEIGLLEAVEVPEDARPAWRLTPISKADLYALVYDKLREEFTGAQDELSFSFPNETWSPPA